MVSGIDAAHAQQPVKSLLEMRRERVVVQSWDLSCGAAALATLLNHQHSDPVGEKSVAISLVRRDEYLVDPSKVRAQQGFSLLDLKRYVEQRGYRGVGYGQFTFAALRERAPMIVPVNFRGYNHFVVFRGVLGDRVLLADPAWGNRTMQIWKFERAWLDYAQFGKVAFAVERSNDTGQTNHLAPLPSDFVMLR